MIGLKLAGKAAAVQDSAAEHGPYEHLVEDDAAEATLSASDEPQARDASLGELFESVPIPPRELEGSWLSSAFDRWYAGKEPVR